jgi:hypothetical protein
MHRPEHWGYVQFSTAPLGKAKFHPDPAGPARHRLHLIYYAQRDYRKAHGIYANTLSALGLAHLGGGGSGSPRLEVTTNGFEAMLDAPGPGGEARHWHIREDARVWGD